MTTTAPEPTVTDLSRKLDQDVAQRFAGDTAEHELTVLRDDGLYKHMRFKKPGTGNYRYDLVTWPGHLTICGDMGTRTFSREEDMLGFFRSNPDRAMGYRINPTYWSEKMQDGGRVTCRRFSPEALRASILEYISDYIGGPTEGWMDRPLRMQPDIAARFRTEVESEVLAYLSWGEHEAMNALAEFRFVWHDTPDEESTLEQLLGAEPVRHEFRFEDWYELTRDEWDFQFLWALHGIVAGIEQYDAWRSLPAVIGSPDPERWPTLAEFETALTGADETERARIAIRTLDAFQRAQECATGWHRERITDLEHELAAARKAEAARA